MKQKMYRNKAEDKKIIDLMKYKKKSENLKDIFKSKTFTISKFEMDILELYDNMGFSERTVICGECGHRGTLRKRGNVYEVNHTHTTPKTHYLGKDFLWTLTNIPVRIVYNPKNLENAK